MGYTISHIDYGRVKRLNDICFFGVYRGGGVQSLLIGQGYGCSQFAIVQV